MANYRKSWLSQDAASPARQAWVLTEWARQDAFHRGVHVVRTTEHTRTYNVVRGPRRSKRTVRIGSPSYDRLERYRAIPRDWCGRPTGARP